MYNQVNRGPHMQPAYQQRHQAPPPPFHFQQGSPAPPGQHLPAAVPPHVGLSAPHIYTHGPPASSSTVPLNSSVQVSSSLVQNNGQSYVAPRPLLHGNSLMPQTFSSFGQNSQHSSNLGVHAHHIRPSVPPPLSNPRHETSWTPGPSSRILPPPPPPPPSSHSHAQPMYRHSVPPCPPPPGDVQSLRHIPPPPPAPSTSGFHASTPDEVYLHSSVGNDQVVSCSRPPLPSCPPPILPSPPPSNSPMTSASNRDVSNLPYDLHSDRKSSKFHISELKAIDSVDEVVASDLLGSAPFPKESGSSKEAAIPDRDGLSSTTNAISDLPSPPCRPTEDTVVEKIEALCRLIVQNGPAVEDKTRHDEGENPEYAFLFGGDSGTEADISHKYFLWMKRKFILEYRWHAKKSESLSRPSRHHDHLNVVAECNSAADSDMEMEDDITLSDKDQGLNNTAEVLNQQHDEVLNQQHDEVIEFDGKNQTQQLQNSVENNPPVLEHLFESEQMNTAKSATEFLCTMGDSVEVVKFPEGKGAAPQADDLTEHGASDPAIANRDRDSGQLLRSGSPMKLLQDYASDDTAGNEDEACLADASTLTVSTVSATSSSVAHKDLGSYLKTDVGSKIFSATQKGCELLSNTSLNESKMSLHPVQENDVTHTAIASGTNDVCTGHNLENQASVNFAASIEPSKGRDVLSSAGINTSSKSGNAEQGDKKTSKLELNPLKVDEFGRVAREDPTDSDSDDSRNHWTRRRNKRDRSWSRSRSPVERSGRRRKRSPWRRKDRRSRSRSWSPQNRMSRSRSRSPILRRSGEFSCENKKRGKGKCFDFLRGKCYRGASCRYLHHEPDKNASSRRHRNKRDLEVSSSKTSRGHEAKKSMSAKVSDDECERVRTKDVLLCQKVSGSSTGQEVEQRKEDSVKNAIVSTVSDHDSQPVNAASTLCESSREVAPEVRETLAAAEELKTFIYDNEASSSQQLLVGGFPSNSISNGNALKLSDGACQDVFPSVNGSSVQLLQPNVSMGMPEHSDRPSQIANNSIVPNLFLDGNTLTAFSGEISNVKPLPCMLPSTQLQSASSSISQHLSSERSPLRSQASKEKDLPAQISVGFPHYPYQLPLPPAISHSYSGNSVQPQMSQGYGAMQQNTPFPYQSTRREPCPGILHAPNPHFCVPPNNSWTSLPPPPPPQFAYSSSLNSGAPTSHVSSESNENKLHLRTDFVSQTSVRTGQPSHIQGAQSQDQAFPTVQEHSRPLTHVETFSSRPLSQGNLVSQSHSDLKISKEDHYKQLPMHDSKGLSSPSFASLQSQSKPFSWEAGVNRLQTSSYKLPAEEHFKSATFIHPSLQKQQTVYGSHYSASDGNLGVHGETVTASRYPPDVLDSNHSASLPDLGGSRISAHYNPYASTFEQPLSSKFSSSIFKQEKDMIHVNNYGSSSSVHRTSVNGQGFFGTGARETASSPDSARGTGQILPRSGSDQYDPLFDSIEPSSASLRKFHLDQKQEVTGESNVSLRPKSSLKSLDVEENEQWEVGATASTSSQNNDEYGETADAEVGAVENESLSNPADGAKMATGEIEIDQVKSPSKRKKSKDSRSMKLFKVSIANFVKEVLKPSWRQGNMSKVAFKTIVKKTVDKVSGAMKGHRVPKSQAKINQYIDSSQRKLTKLVMGYVDKYVKV
ncbi:uncharacterized protein LOC114713312 isoform X2 [Neltuma alba]|uniref:uncharacterized protein LOC114713312 isoform X2 n=1 Tax=Neltuma alba TaxID=207710 RepID=UPI0010A4BB4C|nr:uncharacterized protein LOC114713312 isoform X2 [Prosopis alba]